MAVKVSPKQQQQVLNLAQDVCQAAAKIPTPKHTGTALHILRDTRMCGEGEGLFQSSICRVLPAGVQLQAPPSAPFTGFLLQARAVGGRSPVGSFTRTPVDAQFLSCSHTPNSAVSHTSDSAKTSVTVTWRTTRSDETKPIQFHASFVQSFTTFWVGVTSPTLNFTGPSTSTGPSTGTGPSTSGANTVPPTASSPGISSSSCGVSKVCLSQPSNCDPAVDTNCYFMSATVLTSSDAAVHYEICGPSDGYVSVGFSDDQIMGNDDIYICGLDHMGGVQLQHAFSTGRTTPQTLPLGHVSNVSTSVQDRLISCSFTSMNAISTQRTSASNTSYYIMFAHGPSANGQIQFHRGTFISSQKVDLSKPQLVTNAGLPQIIKAHGALMLIAWMSTGSVGMIVARYLKGVAKGRSLWGKDIWFVVHVAVMCVTVAATVIAFILSFSSVKGWSGGAHPVLGCLVMILSLLQPMVALLRCGPQHPLRFLFNWSHVLNAVVIKALAVAAIFTGLQRVDSSSDQWLIKVMGGFVGWETLLFILLDVNSKCSVSGADASESLKIKAGLLLVLLFCLGNSAFLVALLVGIGMS
ncbi:putative ferric-chelate reductase 1 [Sphaeramia orbicularis]|uniref:putative ferric-chelate reductase 1 n=1 Tax=Sphaeramia orbicularis TaxID=375764 RepID=UPI0011800F58|nr:putative ferric-chelate reductase 1 [Sphaeramia orbicularis]